MAAQILKDSTTTNEAVASLIIIQTSQPILPENCMAAESVKRIPTRRLCRIAEKKLIKKNTEKRIALRGRHPR